MNNHVLVFSDSSINTNKMIGVGCYTIVDKNTNMDSINNLIVNKCMFDNTKSSTIVEMMTIAAALNVVSSTYNIDDVNITVITDCENFKKLIEVRKDHIKYDESDRSNLYKTLIEYHNKMKFNVIWIKGHDAVKKQHSVMKKVFAHIDKAARKISRNLK